MSQYAYGGIYCVIPMGMIYNEAIANSARRKFYSYFKVDAKALQTKTLNQGIVYEIDKVISNEMNHLKYATFDRIKVHNTYKPSQAEKARRWEKLLEEVRDSYGFAIYHNGKRVFYRPVAGNTNGDRIEAFFDENKNKLPSVGSVGGNNTNNWNIVIAVAHYLAARLEAKGEYPDSPVYKGYGKRVILYWAQKIADIVRNKFGRVKMPVQYGYILSRTGDEGEVFRSHQTPL